MVRPYLVTNGGPIVLYAVENEYNWFEQFFALDKLFWFDGGPERGVTQSTDTAGYFTALRDMVRADGIDVPITTCPGDGTVSARATSRASCPCPTSTRPIGAERSPTTS